MYHEPILSPMLDFNAELTGDLNHIYLIGQQGFNDFLQYMYEVVYIHGLKEVVIDWSIAVFFFFLFLSFVCAFIFFTPKR